MKWVGLGIFIKPFEKGCAVDIKPCATIAIEVLQLSHQGANPRALAMGYDHCWYTGLHGALLTQRSNYRSLTECIQQSVRFHLRSDEEDIDAYLPQDPFSPSAREQFLGKLYMNGNNSLTTESPLSIAKREKFAQVRRLLWEIRGLDIQDDSSNTLYESRARACDLSEPNSSSISTRTLDEREYPMLLLVHNKADREHVSDKICPIKIQS